MWNKTLEETTTADIEQLISDATPESDIFEYKQQLPGNGADDRREFLYDVVTSANTSGGFLIFGISEKRDSDGKPTGLPDRICGISSTNLAADVARLENLIRDGIAPRLVDFVAKAFECESGQVLVISIPQSWNSPHFVTFQQTNKFYARVSSGKYLMSIDEIRAAFARGASFSGVDNKMAKRANSIHK